MFYYNRYNDLTKFITNENELKITNEVEIYISNYYDISIDLSYLNSINELDKEFICTISKNVCDIDNTVQKYCQYILKEPDFYFDLAIISIKNNNSIIVDYWGNVFNSQFDVELKYEGNKFILTRFNKRIVFSTDNKILNKSTIK